MAVLSVLKSGFKLWTPNESEDMAIVDACLKIRRYACKRYPEYRDFERRYFVEGAALWDESLSMLNGILSDRGFENIKLLNGSGDGYTLKRGQRKAKLRMRMRDILVSTTDSERATIMQACGFGSVAA